MAGREREAEGFSAWFSGAASPRRCNYHVSSGAYSPGVFNLVLFVSVRTTFFSGEEGEATPGLKLINRQGFTFRLLPAGSCLAASLPAPGAPQSESQQFQARQVLGKPAKEWGIVRGCPAAFNALSPELPPPAFSLLESLGGAYIFFGWS